MKYFKIPSLNRFLQEDAAKFSARAEEVYTAQITAVAKHLHDCREQKPIILLSGPSGSGKTTTALRIEQLLDGWGYETHTISMDNYFLPHEAGPLPVDEHGNIDLESPLRLDAALLDDHLHKLSRCEPIEIPVFDFATQSRAGSNTLHRKPGEMVILEGIHALNPAVTGENDEIASCVYVSVRTRMQAEDGALLHPSKIRLARRLIRNRLFRGRGFEDTLANFRSVSRGESLYIMPYKKRAKFEIDTFFPNELSVYRPFLLNDLLDFPGDSPEMLEIRRFLEQVEPLDASLIPENSLLREFIGGSSFAAL